MVSDLSPSAFQLLNAWQHGFPLISRPFRKLGLSVGLSEQIVLDYFRQWRMSGLLSRIGPVLNPSCMSSTLVGLQVPSSRLEDVAAQVSAMPEVNHNYEREHPVNLWFVMACPHPQALQARLDELAGQTGLHPLSLPMQSAYHIDLGFNLAPSFWKTAAAMPPCCPLPAEGSPQQALLHAVQHGLELHPEPYQELARHAAMAEKQVLDQLGTWLEQGLFRRFGVVLHHRSLGYTANAMCVWTLPDDIVDSVGMQLGREPGVTLCYRRRPHLPQWTHNLFCMIHGKDRAQALQQHERLSRRLGLEAFPHAVLFSTRCFKQRGALLTPAQVHHD